MAFELPALPYSHAALAERGMSQETLELHHDKHHQAYVTALNGFVEKNADLQGKSLEEIIAFANGKADLAPVFEPPASSFPRRPEPGDSPDAAEALDSRQAIGQPALSLSKGGNDVPACGNDGGEP